MLLKLPTAGQLAGTRPAAIIINYIQMCFLEIFNNNLLRYVAKTYFTK
jgi:hypothetical protein